MFTYCNPSRLGKSSKKQLKTDDIYAILSKENLEGISVKPYYDKSPENLKIFQK